MEQESYEKDEKTNVHFSMHNDGVVKVTIHDKEYTYNSIHEAILETRKK